MIAAAISSSRRSPPYRPTNWRPTGSPAAVRPAGLGAWLGAAGAGMVIRVLAGQGTAIAFIVVTFAFLALFILGWRVVAQVSSHFRHSRPSSPRRG